MSPAHFHGFSCGAHGRSSGQYIVHQYDRSTLQSSARDEAGPQRRRPVTPPCARDARPMCRADEAPWFQRPVPCFADAGGDALGLVVAAMKPAAQVDRDGDEQGVAEVGGEAGCEPTARLHRKRPVAAVLEGVDESADLRSGPEPEADSRPRDEDALCT